MFFKIKKKLFLLGAHDLEMNEIKKVLISNKIEFIDKNLTWENSKLSEYDEDLKLFTKNYELYGIELKEDISPPSNYTRVDHHDDYNHKKSSLEQVLDLLGIRTKTREQDLISINDSRHIFGMLSIGATEIEINEIRRRERQTLGITKKDEKVAEDLVYTIKSKSTELLNPEFIESPISGFSAIADRVYNYFSEYIIYNKNKLVFYNYKIKDVLTFLKKKNIKDEYIYYGGGEFGYVGIKEDILNLEEIKKLIKSFSNFVKSVHIFMLPFILDKKELTLNEKWQISSPKVNNFEDFNNRNYFYKHVQDVIFNSKENNLVKNYTYKFETGLYNIEIKEKNENKIFNLLIDSIFLKTINEQVGILTFQLVNYKYERKEDILLINDYGRRIYPQFLSKYSTLEAKNFFLANKISLQIDNSPLIIEDFNYYDKDITSIHIPKHISSLIGDNIKLISDDRMYTMCLFCNNKLSNKLKIKRASKEINDWWFKYIFVDGRYPSHADQSFADKLISKSTYSRWQDFGTHYGISRNSFVCVADESNFSKKHIKHHIQNQYYEMIALLISYRALVIRFSQDIQSVTLKKNLRSHKELYEDYLIFLNRFFFKELTAQEQGIELYDKAFEIMNIREHISNLDNEINELHSYSNLKLEKERNKSLDYISNIGAILLPMTLSAGIYGMNTYSSNTTNFDLCISLLSILFSGLLGYFLLSKVKKAFMRLSFIILFILHIPLSFHIMEKYDPIKKISNSSESKKEGNKKDE